MYYNNVIETIYFVLLRVSLVTYRIFLLKARVMAEAENRTIRKNVLQQKINCTLTRTT